MICRSPKKKKKEYDIAILATFSSQIFHLSSPHTVLNEFVFENEEKKQFQLSDWIFFAESDWFLNSNDQIKFSIQKQRWTTEIFNSKITLKKSIHNFKKIPKTPKTKSGKKKKKKKKKKKNTNK